jgi:hypothetical protein
VAIETVAKSFKRIFTQQFRKVLNEIVDSVRDVTKFITSGPFGQLIQELKKVMNKKLVLKDIPWVDMKKERVCVDLPCGVKMCKKPVVIHYPCGMKWCGSGWSKHPCVKTCRKNTGEHVEYPCGVKLCKECSTIEVPVPTLKTFRFSVADVVNGVQNIAKEIIKPLLELFEAFIQEALKTVKRLVNQVLPKEVAQVINDILDSVDRFIAFLKDPFEGLVPNLDFAPFNNIPSLKAQLPFNSCDITPVKLSQTAHSDSGFGVQFWSNTGPSTCPWAKWLGNQLVCSSVEQLVGLGQLRG